MNVYGIFADIIDYPGERLSERVNDCIELLSSMHGESAELLKVFRSSLEQTAPGRLKEIYTGTFDLQACCYPYVGHYLFGEDFRRSLFMVNLKQHYGKYGFSVEKELPDHLSVMLRFLATENEAGEKKELIAECMVPAVSKMVEAVKNKNNPYEPALESLLLVLRENGAGQTKADR